MEGSENKKTTFCKECRCKILMSRLAKHIKKVHAKNLVKKSKGKQLPQSKHNKVSVSKRRNDSSNKHKNEAKLALQALKNFSPETLQSLADEIDGIRASTRKAYERLETLTMIALKYRDNF